MRLLSRFLTVAIASLVVASFMASSNAQEKPESTPVEGKINWVYDYEQGQFLSAQTGRPMFVVIRCER